MKTATENAFRGYQLIRSLRVPPDAEAVPPRTSVDKLQVSELLSTIARWLTRVLLIAPVGHRWAYTEMPCKC